MAACANVTKSSDESSGFNNTGSKDSEDNSTPNKGVKRCIEDESFAHYPKVLKLMFGPMKCELCSVFGNSPLTMYTHYKGKSHQKKVDKYLKDNNIEIDNSNKKAKREFTVTKCEVCNITLTSELQSLQHYSGKSHKKKMASGPQAVNVPIEAPDPSGRFGIGKAFAPPSPPPPEKSEESAKGSKESIRFCSVCNIFTTSDEAMTAHMFGSKHKKKLTLEKAVEVKNLAKYRTPSDNYYCPSCNVAANSPDQLLLHMSSKKHISSIKKV